MQKIRKMLRAVSEKTALPTNQPTNYYQQHRSYKTSLTPVQKLLNRIILLHIYIINLSCNIQAVTSQCPN